MSSVKPIPEGFIGITPHIIVKDAVKAIEFYKAALGAEEVMIAFMPNTQIVMHAEVSLCGGMLMLTEENEQWGHKGPNTLGGTPVTLHLYVEDVDAAQARAEAAGATVTMPAADMFWGDRYCQIKDPFGHSWSLAAHIKDVSAEEMTAAMENFGKDCG